MSGWSSAPTHGGPDALGVPLHDFSTNSNACGPCPEAQAAVAGADAARYPDPAYTALRERLAAFHGVAAERVLLAASASEFIHRATALAVRSGLRAVALPAHCYGDYGAAARAWGLPACRPGQGAEPALHWACEPSSPLGRSDPALRAWRWGPSAEGLRVLDCAYVPLRLDAPAQPACAPRAFTPPPTPGAWQLWSPNKALGMTGVRAAYAIAPEGGMLQADALAALAPSWPVGAHGVALLWAWTEPSVQAWLAASHATLRGWKLRQEALCATLGWPVEPGSLANYFVARPRAEDFAPGLAHLRRHGIKLRDCASFGLPGHVRLGVLPPKAQDALEQAWAARPPHKELE